jgi:hypothetical protein
VKKAEKLITQRDQLFEIIWCDMQDVHLSSTAHDNRMVKYLSREEPKRGQIQIVTDYTSYKTTADKSNQMLLL